jgi:Tol biopolymer transport system component
MIRLAGCLLLLFMSTKVFGQPGSEIYVYDLKIKKGKITMSNGKNITNHPGYDNQPFFHPIEPLIYYSQADTSGRTDILVYDYSKNSTRKITETSEREFSPTLTPDGKFLSCIIQRDDGVQNLAKYPIAGGTATVLINNLKVGYHAWVNESDLILFVLGEPHTLRWYSLLNKKDTIITGNIGRSLHSIPNSTDMSFVDKSTDPWLIEKMDTKTKSTSKITETLPGREDLCWTPNGQIIMSDGEKLYYFNPGSPHGWKEVEGMSGLLKGVTRLSVNKKGNKIAIVASE